MLPLLLAVVISNSNNGGYLSGLLGFFNSFFPNVDPPADPPQLVSTSGSVFDLPNSNIVEVPPTLPSMEMPINPFNNGFNPSINLFQNSILGSTPFNMPTIPNLPAINP